MAGGEGVGGSRGKRLCMHIAVHFIVQQKLTQHCKAIIFVVVAVQLPSRVRVEVRGLSCSVACGIFPEQGTDPWPLCWQALS